MTESPRPSPEAAACRNSSRSLPAQNAPGAPAIMMQRIVGEVLTLVRAAAITSYMAAVSAFLLSGLAIRSVRIGPSSVTATRFVMSGGFARQRRIAYRGDWPRAIRRGGWVGVLVAIFVVMRLSDIFQVPVALFLLALALVAEVTLTAGSGRGA